MKKYFNFLAVIVMVAAITLLTGCGVKRTELKYEGEEGTIVFNVKEKAGYTISTKPDDFRTGREQAVLIGEGFKIGIEFDADFSYFYEGDFNELKNSKKSYDELADVTYSDIKGFQYFYAAYNRYNVILPCGDSKDYVLNLYIYGAEDTEESAKKAIKNEELLDVLNNIKSIKAAK